MQFYFIRHAQSENNTLMDQLVIGRDDDDGFQAYLRKRYADTELSDLGKQQVEKLGEFFVEKTGASQDAYSGGDYKFDDLQFTHLYVSPMIRTLDTAAPIAAALDLNPVVWEDIHEQGGLWSQPKVNGEKISQPGINPAQLKERYPRYIVPATMKESGWWNRRPYEKMEACFARAGRVLEQLLDKHRKTEDKVALVSHGIFFFCIMTHMLGYSSDNIEVYFSVNNVSITRLDINEKMKRLIYSNRVDFLPPRLIT